MLSSLMQLQFTFGFIGETAERQLTVTVNAATDAPYQLILAEETSTRVQQISLIANSPQTS